MQGQSLRCQRAFTASTPVQRAGRCRLSITCKESRIGRSPIPIPKGVKIDLKGNNLKVKGPNGELEVSLDLEYVTIKEVEGKLLVERASDGRKAFAMHGLSRSLAANIVTGVSTGFTKRMEMVGTGYRASTSAKELTLNVGYSKPRILEIPTGIKVQVEKATTLVISGADKVQVGDFCAVIRRQRPPEPYKGKGIRYAGEIIKLKEGKGGSKKK
eukprot:jgi/Chrzof1/1329/Cz10g03060.t1